MEPKASVMLQKNIKDNAQDLQGYMKDISTWEKEMKAKDKALNQISSQDSQQSLPPVRSKNSLSSTAGPETTKQMTVKKSSENKRKNQTDKGEKISSPKKISGFDYAAWDKFDVDKALKSSDEEGTDEEETDKGKNKGLNDEAEARLKHEENKKPTESEVSKALAFKDEGNKLYAAGKLKEAVSKYTQGMALDPTNAIIPSNRAMAYIKLEKYAKAEADCNCCLSIDQNYIKGYLRRATSRINLGRSEQAAKDYKKVLELEPWNKDAKRELEKMTSVSQKNESTLQSSGDKNTIKEQGSKVHFAPTKPVEKKKKLKIIEVDSGKDSMNLKEDVAKRDPNLVLPIDKSPHLRSKKPLKKISVIDVPSKDAIKISSNKRAAAKTIVSTSIIKEDLESKPENKSAEKSVVSASIIKEDLQSKRENEREEFRKNLSNLSSSSSKEIKPSQAPVIPKPLTVPAVPRTSHQFSQDWLRISKDRDLSTKYIKSIKPVFLHKVELEADILVDMVSLLHSESFSASEAAKYLDSITQSQGFSLNVMFITEEQKKVFSDIMKKCDSVDNFDKTMKRLKDSL